MKETKGLYPFPRSQGARWWRQWVVPCKPSGTVQMSSPDTDYVRALEAAVQAARDLLDNGLVNDCPHRIRRGECITCTLKSTLGRFERA